MCVYIYICHNLFIHSSAVERLGYLYILAVVNNTAMNWYTRICLQTPLAAQWIRICPPIQGTRFQSLVLEDSTGHEAAKPMRHRHWVCALEPASGSYRTCVPWGLKPAHPGARMLWHGACKLLKHMPLSLYVEPVCSAARSYHNEKPAHFKEE